MSDLLKLSSDGSDGVSIEWSDNGTHWRATNRMSRIDPATCQELDHVSAGGSKSGIRYAIGPDELTNQVNILWVDWPKSLFSIEELQTSPQSVKFFAGCNVCSAVNQMTNTKGTKLPSPTQSSSVIPADLQQGPRIVSSPSAPSSSLSPARLSVGDAVLPKYVPVALNLVKSIWLNKLGDAAASIVLALGADMMSGFFDDPKYKKAWQCVSDEMVDGVATCMADPVYVDQVKGDVGRLVDAYHKDGDILEAMLKSMVKPANEVLKSAGIDVRHDTKSQRPINVGKLYTPRVD